MRGKEERTTIFIINKTGSTCEVVLAFLQERRLLDQPIDPAPAEGLELGDGGVAPLRVAHHARSRRPSLRAIDGVGLPSKSRGKRGRWSSDSNGSQHFSLLPLVITQGFGPPPPNSVSYGRTEAKLGTLYTDSGNSGLKRIRIAGALSF